MSLQSEWSSPDGRARLYLGDSLDLTPTVAPGEQFDLVVADPPYCSGASSPAGVAADPVKKYCHNRNAQGRPTFPGDQRDQRSFKYWSTLWAGSCLKRLREGGYFLVFIDWRQLPTMTDVVQAAGLHWRGIVPWDKGLGARAPHKGYFRHQCEYLVWGTKGPCRQHPKGPFDGCLKYSVRKAEKLHITGKPIALLEQLVELAAPGGLIFDPFAGSSTTGVACLRRGRRFVGIELSPQYFRISIDRLTGILAA